MTSKTLQRVNMGCSFSSTDTSCNDAYDSSPNKWTLSKDMPIGLTHAGTAVDAVKGDIDVADGYIEQADGTGQNLGTNKVLKYDVDKNTWSSIPPLPDRIIALGGEYSHNEHVADVTADCTLSTSWTKLTPLPQVRASGIADNIGNKIFSTTGAPRKADDSFQSTTVQRRACSNFSRSVFKPTDTKELNQVVILKGF